MDLVLFVGKIRKKKNLNVFKLLMVLSFHKFSENKLKNIKDSCMGWKIFSN
jgi:hypothetical protein